MANFPFSTNHKDTKADYHNITPLYVPPLYTFVPNYKEKTISNSHFVTE